MAADALLVHKGVFEHRGAGLSSASQLTAVSFLWALPSKSVDLLFGKKSQQAPPAVSTQLPLLLDLAGLSSPLYALTLYSTAAPVGNTSGAGLELVLAPSAATPEPVVSPPVACASPFGTESDYALAPISTPHVCAPTVCPNCYSWGQSSV